MQQKQTILVAPLHWGLGHATRCIPIINALIQRNFEVLLASDGAALLLLQKEFPDLPFVQLPAYNITYSKKGIFLFWKLLLMLPHILKTILVEKKLVKCLVEEGKIQGIISDNRMGIHSKKVPSIYITHQINVLSGAATYFSSTLHQYFIKKYDECWVPDSADSIYNLSGKLGHCKSFTTNIKYIGALSRFQKRSLPKKFDVLILLSGPEPQRTFLEEKLKGAFKNSNKKILLIQGKVASEIKSFTLGNLTTINYLTTVALENAINESSLIICRSGYTTLMDLSILEKNAFFIPTPGQFEQEYLAKRLKNLGIAASCKQHKFSVEKLDKTLLYKGMTKLNTEDIDFDELFSLFQCK